jgi:hypothetical protein
MPVMGPRATMSVDPPKTWPVRIHSASVEVEADYGSIYAQMRYDAYHASISGSASLVDDVGAAQFALGPDEQHAPWNYKENHFGKFYHVPVRRACGSEVRAIVTFRAWWMGVGSGGQFSLDDDQRTMPESDRQDPCPTREVEEPGPGGGGMGDTPQEDVHSYSTCLVRYTYDVATGAIIRRYVLYCW